MTALTAIENGGCYMNFALSLEYVKQ